MSSTMLLLLLANAVFLFPSAVCAKLNSFHLFTNSSSAVFPSRTLSPSSGHAYTISGSSSSATIHLETQTEPSSHSSLFSNTNTWTIGSSSSRVAHYSSTKSSSTSVSTTATAGTSTGRDTTLAQSTSASVQSTILSSFSTSSSGGNTWSFSTTQSTVPFPVYQTPTIVATGGPAETSQAVQFYEVFNALWEDRQLILDPEQKDDYINNIKNTRSNIEAFINNLSVQPPSDVGCSSTSGLKEVAKTKRGLLSVISGLVGDVGSLLACADQVLTDMESVAEEDDPSIPEFEDLTDAIKEIGDDIEKANDNDPTVTSQKTATQTGSQTTTSHSNSGTTSSSGTSKTSSSSSSCSLETALHTTVLCVPTSMVTGSSTVSTITCSPLTTVTTKGCSVTGWATTISSSASVTLPALCATDTCGTSCPISTATPSVDATSTIPHSEYCASIATITTSTLPTASNFVVANISGATPTPGSTATDLTKRSFLKNLEASSDNRTWNHVLLDERALPSVTNPDEQYFLSLEPKWADHPDVVNGEWFPFDLRLNKEFQPKGVKGLFGCTTVAVVSQRGVYLSHIYENPVFMSTLYDASTDAYFQQNSYTALFEGSATSLGINTLIGLDEEGEPLPLNAVFTPQIYVFTPFTTEGQQIVFGIPPGLRYQDRADEIFDELNKAIPGSAGLVFGYRRTDEEESENDQSVAGKVVLEFDNFQEWITTADEPLVGSRVAKWRLWVQGMWVKTLEFTIPWVYEDESATQKRDEDDDTYLYLNPCTFSTASTSTDPLSSTAVSTTLASTSIFRTQSSTAVATTLVSTFSVRTQSSTTPTPISPSTPTTMVSSTSQTTHTVSGSVRSSTGSQTSPTASSTGFLTSSLAPSLTKSPPLTTSSTLPHLNPDSLPPLSMLTSSSTPAITTVEPISTESGSSCVSTLTTTLCEIPQEACITSAVCNSWVATATATSTSTRSPTPTGQVYIDIFTDSDCGDLLEQTQLNTIGQCYSPTDSSGNPISFKCFEITYISTAASNSASLSAFKGAGCFSDDDSDVKDYATLTDIDYEVQKTVHNGILVSLWGLIVFIGARKTSLAVVKERGLLAAVPS